MSQTQAYTLSQLARRITALFGTDPGLHNVWITAETWDVRVSGGHCYLELVEKDDAGKIIARARATIWNSTFRVLAANFLSATGQQFGSNLKVMVCVCANFSAPHGFSYNIVAINPVYTLGDALQRRAQMIERLRREGIIDMNRTLPWPSVPQRIAVVSAKGAAGYGDFIHQLYNNASRLRFTTNLFPATVQGERAASSIIAALELIASQEERWDCVVIIRGGGSTSDLSAFDHYELAANVAQFPLPIIIGIGHERDITLLDYVANMRVKTPTAAAEWLIQRGEQALGRLQYIASAMMQMLSDRISGCQQQLAYIQGALPAAAMGILTKAQQRLETSKLSIASVADRRITPALTRLDTYGPAIAQAANVAISRARQRLEANSQLLSVLSPEATLRRGYSIVRVAGHSVTAKDIRPGEVIDITFADGSALAQTLTVKSEE